MRILCLLCTWWSLINGAPYSFITLGDWGGEDLGSYFPQTVDAVAAQMGKTADANPIKFIFNVGDNYYWCGIKNTSDPQITADYLNVYTASSLQVPWYSTLGNHDYGYNPEAQIRFTYVDPTKRWYMPARYYSKRLQLSDTQYLTFIVMDTSPCIAHYRSDNASHWGACSSAFPSCGPIDKGPCRFHENIMGQECRIQLAWFKWTLRNTPKGDWLVVMGHHPAEEIDVEDFVTSMQERGFDLYLNGHAHILEQYTVNGQGTFLTSGAGALVKTLDQETDEHVAEPSGLSPGIPKTGGFGHVYQKVWKEAVAGFTLHTFNEDFSELKTEFIDAAGQVLRTFTIRKVCDVAAYPCEAHCTYIRKADAGVCKVENNGCYDCTLLAQSGCPACSGDQKSPEQHGELIEEDL